MKTVAMYPGCFSFAHVARSIAVAAGLLLFQHAQAALTRDEQFDYSAGTLNSQGGWTVTGGTAPATVEAGNLNVTGLATSTGSQVQMDGAGGTALIANTADTLNTTVNGNAVYASFMVHITDPTTFTTTAESFAELGIGANYYCAVYVKDAGSGNMAFGIRRATGGSPSSQTGTVPNTAASVFIVVKYEVSTGGNDSAKMWVNPSSTTFGGASDPASPAISTSGGSDAANGSAFGGFRWTAGIGAEIDSLRIGRTYADVTPTTPPTCDPPTISEGPTNQTVNVNSSAYFAITPGGSNPTFQWQTSNSVNNAFTDVGGATASSYTTPPLALSDSGSQYRCIEYVGCTNAYATSTVATVTVLDLSGFSFRSHDTGPSDWTTLATWEQSTNGVNWDFPATFIPSAANTNITIRSGHTVTVSSAVTADCDVLGTIQVTSGVFSNSGANLKFESGSTFIWSSTTAVVIPTAAWADQSTCEIQNGTTTTPAGLGQSFYDFHWDKTSSGAVNLGAQLTTVRHDLRMVGSSDPANSVRFLGAAGTCDLFVGNDVILEGGYTTLSGGSGAGTILNLYIGRNLAINSGATLDSRTSGTGSAANINFTNTAVTHSITNSGGIGHSGTGGGCPINWNIAASVSVTLQGGSLTLSNANNSATDSVTVNGTLDCNGNQIVGVAATGSGAVSVNAGGTLIGSGTSQITANLTTMTFDGTLNLPGLPTFSGGETFVVFGATTYTITSIAIVPSTPPGATSWDTTLLATSGTLQVVGGGGPVAGNPRITSVARSGSNIVISGTNGTHNGTYYVITSTNAGLARTNWTSVETNTFDGSGNFTNTIPMSGPRQFISIEQLP